ncbi:hypothetical protein WMY93_021369 [Mugilogobius chulae]|uniref:SH3 domain-binding protein 2 n=1 Tax=Mugilogobius chulae TaxID=88201 RepID=A0AAW0NKK1_9GOBI
MVHGRGPVLFSPFESACSEDRGGIFPFDSLSHTHYTLVTHKHPHTMPHTNHARTIVGAVSINLSQASLRACVAVYIEWEEDYFFVSSNAKLICLICNATVAIAKRGNLERHFKTTHARYEKDFPAKSALRSAKVRELKAQLAAQQAIFTRPLHQIKAATIASFRVANVLIRHKKPFSDSEVVKEAFLEAADTLFNDFRNKTELMKVIKDVQLSRRTTTKRCEFMAADIKEQLRRDIDKWEAFSLQLDESTDVKDIAQLSVFIRMNLVKQAEIPLFKLVSITTDGAPAMAEQQRQEKEPDMGRYESQIESISAEFERRFTDFALIEPLATYMCNPFATNVDVDYITSKVGTLFNMESSAVENEVLSLQNDIEMKAKAASAQPDGPPGALFGVTSLDCPLWSVFCGVSLMDVPSLLQSGVTFLRQSAAVDSVDRWLHRTSRVFQTMASPEPVWPVPMRAIGAQNLLTMPGGVSTAGYLHKKGGSQFSLMKWPLRYIIIHKGCIYYFKSSTSAAPQGAFSLNGYNRVMRAAEETTSSNVFPFKIVHFSKKHRTWLFSAASEEERRSWMRHLRREIDHYNERQESHTPSDTDSDSDSFYGTIERPLDIKHPIDNTDDDYMEEDDDDDEEDYLKPDSSPTNTGRPTGPPPSYPPPPVPASALSNQLSTDSRVPPIPPPIHRIPTSPLPKKPLIAPPPLAHKGPPPEPPFAPHLQRHTSFSPATPPLPPPNPKRTVSRAAQGETREHPPQMTTAICKDLESRLQLNRSANHLAPSYNRSPAPSPANIPAPNPAPSYNRSPAPAKPSSPALTPPPATTAAPPPAHYNRSPTPSPANIPSYNRSPAPSQARIPAPNPTHNYNRSPAPSPANNQAHSSANRSPTPSPAHNHSRSPTHSSAHGPPLPNHVHKPKPPPPKSKPPLPKPRKHPSTSSLGRASPEGQSFRASAEEVPVEFRTRWDSVKPNGKSDDDDDYENVQLPDSVFIDSTETSYVEKLFRESGVCPDGLYAIRNSGTKTSKVLVVWDISINKARNYRLFEEKGCIYLDLEVTFPSLAILIEHYYSHTLPQHDSLFLQKPYSP